MRSDRSQEAETVQLALKEPKTGDVAATLLSERTISVTDDGDFYIGDFAVEARTLIQPRSQPGDLLELSLRWTNPGEPTTSQKARVAKLLPVVQALREDGLRLQLRLPRN